MIGQGADWRSGRTGWDRVAGARSTALDAWGLHAWLLTGMNRFEIVIVCRWRSVSACSPSLRSLLPSR